MDTSVFWLTLAVFFCLAELGHPGLFFFLALACGSFATAFAFNFSFFAQLTVFLSVSAVLFLILRKLQKKVSKHSVATNMYALIGKKAVVIEDICPQMAGQVKIDGELWKAHCAISLKKDELVEVVRVTGCHVLVKPFEIVKN